MGFASPCSTPWDVGGAVSTTVGGLNRGARFFFRAVGPIALGDRAPESAVFGGWRRSRMEVGWLAERPDSGQEWFTMQHARTGQMRMREARSRIPHVPSRQDSMFNVRAMSTVHRSPTINPHLPLMLIPSTSDPDLKYCNFRWPYLSSFNSESGGSKA